MQAVCAYGGSPIKDQIAEMKKGAEIIVCTPGRMIDLLTANSGRVTNLKRVTYLVLDEADRMLDESFEKDIRAIIGGTHAERQIAMFSATWPQSIQKLAHEFLTDPVEVTIGSDQLAASHNVTQIVEVMDDRARDARSFSAADIPLEPQNKGV